MPNYREVRVWSGTEWEALSIAYPDMTAFVNKGTDNTLTGVNTFNGRIVRPSQVPYAIETGSINLTTTTSGDSLIIGSKSFDLGRFTQIPVVMLTVRYPGTIKNGYATVKALNADLFNYEVVMDVPVTDGQAPTYPLKLDYVAIQMTA